MRASKHIKMKRMWQKDEFKQNINVLSPFVIKKKQHCGVFLLKYFKLLRDKEAPCVAESGEKDVFRIISFWLHNLDAKLS